jgi:hypothetical protein
MGSSALVRVAFDDQVRTRGDVRPPRHLRIRCEAGSWRVSEDGPDRIGGRFVSLTSAVDFARGELRGVCGGRVLIELGPSALDERP